MAETLAVIRDLAVIILAILNIVLVTILVIIAYFIWRLVKAIRRELPALANTARETLTTVEGTTDFLGTAVARPAIDAIGFFAAARRFLRVLTLSRSAQRQPEVRQ